MGTDVTGAAASLPGGLVSVESHDGGMSGTNRDDTGGLLDPLHQEIGEEMIFLDIYYKHTSG